MGPVVRLENWLSWNSVCIIKCICTEPVLIMFACLNLPLRATWEHEQHLYGLLIAWRKPPDHTTFGSVNRRVLLIFPESNDANGKQFLHLIIMLQNLHYMFGFFPLNSLNLAYHWWIARIQWNSNSKLPTNINRVPLTNIIALYRYFHVMGLKHEL